MTPLSRLGLGTYLGEEGPEAQAGYVAAIRRFHALGGTVFDTAANYRRGRSERALGEALEGTPRDAYFLSTKAGYLPMGDGVTDEHPRDWFHRVLLGPGVLTPEDLVEGIHCLSPGYLRHQLSVSLEALRVEAVDVFHLHNPEHARPRLGPRRFEEVMREAFRTCEALVEEGRIRAYGVATWSGFRVGPDRPDHLSLEALLRLAEEAGGKAHHFQWVQVPLNLGMPEALLEPTQVSGGRRISLLQAARNAKLKVQASAAMLQARILPQVAEQLGPFRELFPGCETPAQVALQFTASAPGVTTALCGMGQVAHVEANAPVLKLPPVPPGELARLFA